MRGLDCEVSFHWFQDFHLLVDGCSYDEYCLVVLIVSRWGPERSVEVPMMQDEVRLVLDWVRHGRSHHRDLAVLHVDVEMLIAKWTEEARLGRLDGFREGECRRLCDLGRDERYVRLNGVARRGLRGTETGRLSGAPW